MKTLVICALLAASSVAHAQMSPLVPPYARAAMQARLDGWWIVDMQGPAFAAFRNRAQAGRHLFDVDILVETPMMRDTQRVTIDCRDLSFYTGDGHFNSPTGAYRSIALSVCHK